ncbi:assimilatory sulfite reductase (NADPH) flavoprotein subunit [Kangiella koreensis]|uniref:Sulfite reductase [NADPH] flavoprotein alpha-component n=1 Tax=Kangiella koreensis (strain DSM 16069 / JCM 12317 / KCTC 12182 / SW-125) TaxID=523791 RepID=C7RA27_KANKD|nr:assimilatory sulfite reductase (NADPH) flavoprotein subunit [Kangiella koreensis]ACV26146.1 FAD-binding domain protein [Kangiella koreensis DSM 16069]
MTVKEQQLGSFRGKPLNDELLHKIRNLNAHEINWLSGYCAGLLDSQSENLAAPVVDNLPVANSFANQAANRVSKSAKPVLVLYASQTGNAQSIAEQLIEHLQAKSVTAHLKSTLEVAAKELADYSTILLVASTHGEGEPPDDAIDLYEALTSKKLLSKGSLLKDTNFAVLGLGDSSYEFFCQTAKDFAESFSKLGAQQLSELVLCDVDYQQPATQWVEQVSTEVAALIAQSSTELDSSNSAIADVNVLSEQTAYSKDNPFKATVATIQKITGRGSPKETYHLEIDIEDSNISYEPGDALGIVVHNPESLVDEIISLLDLDAETSVNYQNQNSTLKKYLTEFAELTLISKSTIKGLLELESNDELQTIYDHGYSEFIINHQFVDLLHIAQPTIIGQQLVDILKPIKPRLYSIACSQQEFEDEVHLTLNHVSVNNTYGERYGLASHHLTQLISEGETVSVFVEHNPKFKLPTVDAPIIMVGPGTGVAPFRAFLQERAASNGSAKNSTAKNWLIFGNPHFDTDFLYQVEIQKYVSSGLLNKLDLAFSRDSEQKVYVQHKLLDNAQELWQWLEQGAYFYVCGDMHKMAKDVEQTLLTIIQEQGQRDEEEAKQYLKALKVNQRYQRDVY